MANLVNYYIQFIKRDLQLAVRQKHEFVLPLLFFVLILILFPVTVGPESGLLARLAPAVGWINLILSLLIALPRMFSEDYENGWLEQVFLAAVSPSFFILTRILSFWLLYCLPLVICSVLLVPFMSLPFDIWWVLAQTLFLGSLLVAALGSVASALLVASRKGSGVLALLLLPMLIPALIFGSAVIEAAQQSLPYLSPMLLLAALAVFCLTIAPVAAAQAIKINLG
ncbi:heme exporter protein CcmB [Gayadomonas joobiniege]|uniref:heme exporter protein CcmB n=1 Tax=Gayadomonas joobiniege TaxID=1234606 RepID=UPI000375BB2E|nr:heme exporter protein CcmB [Gayadomonas joobiniege]